MRIQRCPKTLGRWAPGLLSNCGASQGSLGSHLPRGPCGQTHWLYMGVEPKIGGFSLINHPLKNWLFPYYKPSILGENSPIFWVDTHIGIPNELAQKSHAERWSFKTCWRSCVNRKDHMQPGDVLFFFFGQLWNGGKLLWTFCVCFFWIHFWQFFTISEVGIHHHFPLSRIHVTNGTFTHMNGWFEWSISR